MNQFPHQKLTPEDVRMIRQICIERRELEKKLKAISNREIAKKFDICPAHVSRIDRRVMWSGLT